MRANITEKDIVAMGPVSILSPTATVTGEVNAENDIRIDGGIDGNVNCKGKILIGPSGCVKGDVNGRNVELLGKIYGNVVVEDTIVLRSGSFYHGEITAKNLEVEAGASFFGTCKVETNRDNRHNSE